MIAVSQTGDPTGIWNIYVLPTTDDGSGGTPTHANCPCFGDQPLLGADANALFISTNEFPLFAAGFNGAQVYAISKRALVKGLAANVVQFNLGTLQAPDGGTWYSVQPATVPPNGAYAANTEFFLSASVHQRVRQSSGSLGRDEYQHHQQKQSKPATAADGDHE
jgi:hypothetical protein